MPLRYSISPFDSIILAHITPMLLTSPLDLHYHTLICRPSPHATRVLLKPPTWSCFESTYPIQPTVANLSSRTEDTTVEGLVSADKNSKPCADQTWMQCRKPSQNAATDKEIACSSCYHHLTQSKTCAGALSGHHMRYGSFGKLGLCWGVIHQAYSPEGAQ